MVILIFRLSNNANNLWDLLNVVINIKVDTLLVLFVS